MRFRVLRVCLCCCGLASAPRGLLGAVDVLLDRDFALRAGPGTAPRVKSAGGSSPCGPRSSPRGSPFLLHLLDELAKSRLSVQQQTIDCGDRLLGSLLRCNLTY